MDGAHDGTVVGKARGVDWAILMAHAQSGDQDAYRRLLEEITPYVRSLAFTSHRDPADIEDSVQDVLLTVHAVRHTYDPTRPFGPWLVAIAHRRATDRLRRQGRTTARETPLTEELKPLQPLRRTTKSRRPTTGSYGKPSNDSPPVSGTPFGSSSCRKCR